MEKSLPVFTLFHQLPREIVQFICSHFLTGKDLSTLWVAHVTTIGSTAFANNTAVEQNLIPQKQQQQEQQETATSFLVLLYHVLNERLVKISSPSDYHKGTTIVHQDQQQQQHPEATFRPVTWDPSPAQKDFIYQVGCGLQELQRQLQRRRYVAEAPEGADKGQELIDNNNNNNNNNNEKPCRLPNTISLHRQRHQTRHFSTACFILDYFDEAVQRSKSIRTKEDGGAILWCGTLETGTFIPSDSTGTPSPSNRRNGSTNGTGRLLNMFRSQLTVQHDDGITIVIRSSSHNCWSLRELEEWRQAGAKRKTAETFSRASATTIATTTTAATTIPSTASNISTASSASLPTMHNMMHNMHNRNIHDMISTMHSNPSRMGPALNMKNNLGSIDTNLRSDHQRQDPNATYKCRPLIRTRAQPYNVVPVPPYGRVYGKTKQDEERLDGLSRYLAKHDLVLVKSASEGNGFIFRIISSEQARHRLATRFGSSYRPPDSWIVEDPSYTGLICTWEYSDKVNDTNDTSTVSIADDATDKSVNGETMPIVPFSESILEILNSFYCESGEGRLMI